MVETKYHKDMMIGDVLKTNPNTVRVIEKYFGGGCFQCPGMRTESIAFGALMHNIDPDVVVSELNAVEEE